LVPLNHSWVVSTIFLIPYHVVNNEDFLHFIWKYRLYYTPGLTCTSGDALEIIHPGFHNLDAGPDFCDAKIRIGTILWSGNVEIHCRSSDWNRHQHQVDQAYDNVILHVVSHHDQKILRTDGTEISVLEIGHLIPKDISKNYSELMHSLKWIPCEDKISHLDSVYIHSSLSGILIERLESKSEQIYRVLSEVRGSWDDAFYILLARNFGFKTNALPFEMLARSLPKSLIARYKSTTFQIESLIFGQAGFLEGKFKDEYPNLLKQEYNYLQKKHGLKPIDKYLWKYMRLRPGNFPTIRLAQFAALLSSSNHLFARIIEETEPDKVARMFKNLKLNDYWNRHYRFDKEGNYSLTAIGEEAINNILINTVAYFLFAYGLRTGSEWHRDRAIFMLEGLKSEQNSIIRRFSKIGIKSDSSALSQALIELKKSYCDQKKCLSCMIGIKFLRK